MAKIKHPQAAVVINNEYYEYFIYIFCYYYNLYCYLQFMDILMVKIVAKVMDINEIEVEVTNYAAHRVLE